MCEEIPAQKLPSIAWTAISYVTLPITVFICEQRPAQKATQYSMNTNSICDSNNHRFYMWTESSPKPSSIGMNTSLICDSINHRFFIMCEHVRPKLSKNKPLNLLLKWKALGLTLSCKQPFIIFSKFKILKKNNAQLNIKWGTNSRYNLCLVAFFIHSSHITQCMILAGRNEFNNRTLLYNLHHYPNKSKASREVRFKSLVCNRNGRNLVYKLLIYERR